MDHIQQWLDYKLALLEKAFQSGNHGALQDTVFYCREYKRALPEWASSTIFLANNSQAGKTAKSIKWPAWLRRHRQDMKDYTCYDMVLECRENGLAWEDCWGVAAMILPDETGEATSPGAVKKAHHRVVKRLKTDPLRYFLLKTYPIKSSKYIPNKKMWDAIKIIQTNSRPKGVR